MVWAGTPVITHFSDGDTPAVLVTFAGLDANSEFGVFDAWSEHLKFAPRAATVIITTTAGTTAGIDVDLDVSMDNTTYTTTNINNITASLAYANHPNPDWGEPDTSAHTAWRYWKLNVVAVGAGNTLSAALWLTP